MGYTYADVAVTIGENILKDEKVQKGVKTTLKGLGAIGAGTVLETVGAGTAIGATGSALTYTGCIATQAVMTGVSTALPRVLGTAASGAIGSAATGIFLVASSPIALGGIAVAGITYGICKLFK